MGCLKMFLLGFLMLISLGDVPFHVNQSCQKNGGLFGLSVATRVGAASNPLYKQGHLSVRNGGATTNI